MSSIEAFYRAHYGLQDQEILRALAAASTVRRLRAGELLVREGEVQREVPFLVSGVIRSYYYDAGGKDVTDCLDNEAGAPVVTEAELGQPSRLYLEVLVETEVIALPVEDVRRLIRQYPALLEIYNRLLTVSYSKHWEIKTVITRSTAMQRYQWFLRRYPGLSDQVNQKYIASFLEMTPVTLSRLRRKLREQRAAAPASGPEALPEAGGLSPGAGAGPVPEGADIPAED